MYSAGPGPKGPNPKKAPEVPKRAAGGIFPLIWVRESELRPSRGSSEAYASRSGKFCDSKVRLCFLENHIVCC